MHRLTLILSLAILTIGCSHLPAWIPIPSDPVTPSPSVVTNAPAPVPTIPQFITITNPVGSGSQADKTNAKVYRPPYHQDRKSGLKWSSAIGTAPAQCFLAGQELPFVQIDSGEPTAPAARLCFYDTTRPVYTLPRPCFAILAREGRIVAAVEWTDFSEPTSGTSKSNWIDLPRTLSIPTSALPAGILH